MDSRAVLTFFCWPRHHLRVARDARSGFTIDGAVAALCCTMLYKV